jgi:hypothetical protein
MQEAAYTKKQLLQFSVWGVIKYPRDIYFLFLKCKSFFSMKCVSESMYDSYTVLEFSDLQKFMVYHIREHNLRIQKLVRERLKI